MESAAAYQPRESSCTESVLSLVLGGLSGAWVNRLGLALWLAKHRSSAGPATVLEGMLVGASVGMGGALLPPLTSLIATNHLDQAKTFIIGVWLCAIVLGAGIGALLAVVGRRYIAREELS